MDRWQHVWRNGLARQFSRVGLKTLRRALKADDPRLLQGRTTFPAFVAGGEDLAVEGCCALAWVAWQGEGHFTVGQVTECWDRLCLDADAALGEPGACKAFFDWYDDTPRSRMRRQLLEEVNRALASRRPVQLEAA